MPARSPANERCVTVRTTHGVVRGIAANGVLSFKGIPFAGPVSGEHRFRQAPPLAPWRGERDAFAYGPAAISAPAPAGAFVPAESEDCLFLNIWTPGVADGRLRPVMVYNNPGGNGGSATASGAAHPYEGAALARDYDVVVMTNNNRAGLLGNIYLAGLLGDEYADSSSAQLLDVIDALTWLQRNAEAFGGDPGNIMVFGESQGAGKTNTLLAMPDARGLIHKYSSESYSTIRLKPVEEAEEMARGVLAGLGIPESRAQDLLGVPTAAIKSQQPIGGNEPSFSFVLDGRRVPNHPSDPRSLALAANLPGIYGYTKDETVGPISISDPSAFALDESGLRARVAAIAGPAHAGRIIEVYRRARPAASPTDLYVAITSGRGFMMNAMSMTEGRLRVGSAPMYLFEFSYESEVPAGPGIAYPLRATHGMDLGFKLNHPELVGSSGQRPERFALARAMSAAFAAFARTGNPNHDGIPFWPAYTLDKREAMVFNAESRVVGDLHGDERRLWEELGYPGTSPLGLWWQQWQFAPRS